jgi:hypothetical protein
VESLAARENLKERTILRSELQRIRYPVDEQRCFGEALSYNVYQQRLNPASSATSSRVKPGRRRVRAGRLTRAGSTADRHRRRAVRRIFRRAESVSSVDASIAARSVAFMVLRS